jgi:hypothetical protein
MNFMDMKRYISIIFLSLLMGSRINGQTNITGIPFSIDIKKNFKNFETINLSEIGKEISYLPLETSSLCLIEVIEKVLLSKSFIFINDAQKRLLQFDRTGKFIRQIGSKGRGPEEYLYVYDFCINELTSEIYIFGYDKMVIFSFDGKFKKANKLSFRIADAILLNNTSLMFHLPNAPGRSYFNVYSWIITDMQGTPIQRFKNHVMRVNNVGVSKTPIYVFEGSARFMEHGIDTLYYFKDAIKSPYVLFSFGDLKMDPDPLISPENAKVNEGLKNKISIWTILENEEFLFFKFSKGGSNNALFAIYRKKTEEFTFLKDDVFKNDLNGGGKFWPKQITDNKILIDYVDAFTFLKSDASKKLKYKLTETSNPVIIFLK